MTFLWQEICLILKDNNHNLSRPASSLTQISCMPFPCLLWNEIDKTAYANGKNVVINITIPQQKEFMTMQGVADMLRVRKKLYIV